MTELERFSQPLTGAALRDLLALNIIPKTVATGGSADLETLRAAIDELPRTARGLSAATDSELAPMVYQVLKDVPRRVTLDSRFWHWLTCIEFPNYVKSRWAPNVDFDLLDAGLTPGQTARFLGGDSLAGFGRNALSRMFWAAEAMGDSDEDYHLTRSFFSRADLVAGVLEREFGLLPAVIRACTSKLVGLDEDDRREALKRLSLRASTVQLEGADEADVARLLKA